MIVTSHENRYAHVLFGLHDDFLKGKARDPKYIEAAYRLPDEYTNDNGTVGLQAHGGVYLEFTHNNYIKLKYHNCGLPN